MSLRYRIAFYCFGVLIGGYFIGEFLTAKAKSKGVEFCYFPNCRVIKDLKNKSFEASSTSNQFLSQNKIGNKALKELLVNGDVDFSESNTKPNSGKTYVIYSYTTDNKKVKMVFKNYSEKAFLEEINFIKK